MKTILAVLCLIGVVILLCIYAPEVLIFIGAVSLLLVLAVGVGFLIYKNEQYRFKQFRKDLYKGQAVLIRINKTTFKGQIMHVGYDDTVKVLDDDFNLLSYNKNQVYPVNWEV